VLRFSPTAWAKLLYMRDAGPTEIGGFGITAEDDLLYVESFQIVRQTASSVHIAFDDEAVADFFEDAVDRGLQPRQFMRVWIHCHPADSAEPSETDEQTFERVFGDCDWAVMFILARGGAVYARLRFNAGPGGAIELPVEVDYSQQFPGADHDTWEAEYEANVKVDHRFRDGGASRNRQSLQAAGVEELCWPDEWLDELQAMDGDERQALLEDLAAEEADPWAWEVDDVC
jgi:proteasome lid subunit RPN8/RPN11